MSAQVQLSDRLGFLNMRGPSDGGAHTLIQTIRCVGLRQPTVRCCRVVSDRQAHLCGLVGYVERNFVRLMQCIGLSGSTCELVGCLQWSCQGTPALRCSGLWMSQGSHIHASVSACCVLSVVPKAWAANPLDMLRHLCISMACSATHRSLHSMRVIDGEGWAVFGMQWTWLFAWLLRLVF